MRDKLSGDKPNLRFIGVEPASCPTLTKGSYDYDFGDTAGMTPLMKMYTLGHDFVAQGYMEAASVDQLSIFEAAVMFAHNEGILPAPESSHAIRVAVDEALKCKESGEAKVIAFNLSGHGMLDLSAYDSFLSGKMR